MSKEKTITAVQKIRLLMALCIAKQFQGEIINDALNVLDAARAYILKGNRVVGNFNEVSTIIHSLKVRD